MNAADLCQKHRGSPVFTAGQGENVSTAARRMREHRIGSLVVLDEDGRLAGILSERDIIARVLDAGRDASAVAVAEVMTRDVVSCSPEMPLEELQYLMDRRRIRHLPVVEDGRVVGMISSREIIAYQARKDRGTRDLTVFAVAKLAESRDTDTGLHLERVRSYARVLARQMKRRRSSSVDGEFIALLGATCPLHDIGKVSIPDCILLKPDRLTDEEFAIMKTHTVKGAETLDIALRRFPDARFLRMGRDIAAYHHEWYNGAGYPEGRREGEIPLSARIFAIADVYDALVTRRVYKEAYSHELARDIVIRGGGTQFDPEVVEAFGRSEQVFDAIRNRYGDVKAAA